MNRHDLRRDLRSILVVGAPLVVNNISSIGVSVGDTLMASALGPVQLAGVALGSGVWIALFLLGLGLIMAIGPTVAQHYGAHDYEEIGHDTRQGLWLALAVSALVITLMFNVEPVLLAVGIEQQVAALAQGYLSALTSGVVAAYAYHTLKQMSEGIGRTIPIMTVMAIALPVNIGLNYIFMFGRLGAPAMGAVGCGLGNALGFWFMLILLAGHVLRAPAYAPLQIWRLPLKPDPARLRRLVALGSPIGLSLFLQSGLFTTVALMMGALGTISVAAHQIVLNWSGLVFMVPLGLGMALTVCVGQAVGRGDISAAARVGYTGMILCGALALTSCLVTLWLSREIAAVYSSDPSVVALCTRLLLVAAFLQLFDGIQVAAAFALRGMKDTRAPLFINAVNYWVVGFGLAYLLGFVLDKGAPGIWIGLTAALGSAGLCLILRFRVITGRLAVRARAVAELDGQVTREAVART